MHSLIALSKSKSLFVQHFAIASAVTMLLLTGCSNELPNGTEQGDDITLATKIEREASVQRVNNLASIATWSDDDGRLSINGLNRNGSLGNGLISVTNAATGQFVGNLNFDDDDRRDSNNSFALRNLASIPCSIRVQVGGQVQIIPVQNAPAGCAGITVTPTGLSINVLQANWKASTNKLTVEGLGASPRQLVSVFDSVSGLLLGTDQSDAIGNWKIRARNLLVAPCAVTVVSVNQTAQAIVTNAPSGCANIPAVSNPGVINGFNQAPEGVIIGPIADMAISVGSSVNFMGTGFDPDSNSILNYRWGFDGAAPDSSQQNQTVIFSTAGVYRVTLNVTDNFGASDPTPDTRVIVVQPNLFNNQAPTGVISSPASNIEINAGQSVYIAGSGFDPEGTQLRYVWNFAGGAINSTQATPGNVIFSTPGVFLISLTVIDSAGMADSTPEVRAITVRGGNTGINSGIPGSSPTNQAPNGEIISPASNLNVAIGQSISFMGTAFDPDSNGAGLRYRWDFGTLAPASTQLNPGPVTFNSSGVYLVTFTVTDALGMVDPTPSMRTITVGGSTGGTGGSIGGNQAPNALISFPTNNQTITSGQSITFSGSGFDPENNVPLTYLWDFGGATSPSSLQNPGAVVFNQPGTYIVSLSVTDNLGARDLTPDIRTITVLGSGNGGTQFPGSNIVNLDPESQINSPANDLSINVGDSVEFIGFGTDPENNSPLIYSWNFDGAAPNMLVQNPGRVVFTRAGSYRVRLTVIDTNGNADKTPAERMITVKDAFSFNTDPSGTITSPATSTTINVGASVNFSGFASTSSGNNLLTYEWDFGGAAIASNLQNPGSVQFNKAGIYKVTFYVKDNLGFYDPTPDVRYITVQGGVNNINQAPEASIVSPATDLEINLGDSVSFVGTGQDLDNFGANLTYMWNFGGAFASSSVAAPGRLVFNTAGTYTVSLTVMDNFGLSDMTPATRTITVRNTAANNNRAPIVTIINPVQQFTTVSIGQKLNFSATATDPDNDVVTKYEWNFDGAAPDAVTQNPVNIPFSTPGTYKVTVVAVDARGQRSIPAFVTVNVTGSGFVSQTAPEGSIVAPANNMTISVGDTINFQGVATDADGNSPLMYRWNFNGAAASSYAQNPGNVTFNKVGVYQVQLTAVDSTGATDLTPAIRTITVVAQAGTGVLPPNAGQAPIVTMTSPINSVTSINIGGAVNFSSSVVDPDNSVPFTYRWSFGNGMPDQFVANPGNIFFTQAGTYIVTLTVTDAQNNIGVVTKTVIVGNGGQGNVGNGIGAPNGIINAPATGVSISRGQSVYFAGDAIDPTGDANIRYSWDFSNGAPASTQKIPGNVVFSTQGRYLVTLTVTNSLGNVDQTPASVVVTVLP